MMFYEYFIIFIVILLFMWLVVYIYKKCQRISSLSDLPPDISDIWLRGKVVSVGDGDGFKFYHVPWFRSDDYSRDDPTLRIRLAGIDAPETASFGNPGQPFSAKARETLKELVLNQYVKLKLLKVDQYDRILATCYKTCLSGLFKTTNVNAKMVELGMACMYRGRDAIYDGYKDKLIRLQEDAREKGIGIWSLANYESPMDYKKKIRDRN